MVRLAVCPSPALVVVALPCVLPRIRAPSSVLSQCTVVWPTRTADDENGSCGPQEG